MTDDPDTAASSPLDLWRQAAERAIGAGVETLCSRSVEGLEIAPLYPPARDAAAQPWRRDDAWRLAQRVDHPDPEIGNRLALSDLEGGADSLVLVDFASLYARGFGFDIAGGDLDVALSQIELDFITLRIDAGAATPDAVRALVDLVEARRLTSAGLAVDSGYDPIGIGARRGAPLEDDRLDELIALRTKANLTGAALLADGRPWHEAGAGEAQELAAVLATAVAYLRRLEALGLDLDAARHAIAVLLASDADVVLGVAKVRAMRRLWARLEAACGLEPAPLRLHAETSWRMMARHDPWTNVMRTTAATFAAGIGGADAVCVLPFTLPLGLPDDAARRLARNSQTILMREAHLARVVDPAAGAGGFEALTDALCADAWQRFQEIERQGGLPRALSSLQSDIAETAARRADSIATLRQGLIGTSRFASFEGDQPAVLPVDPRAELEAGSAALPSSRDAMPFETLRARADAMAAAHGRPAIFLATLGSPAAFGPSAAYAINYFASAGIVATAGLETRDHAALLQAFKDSGMALACVCGPTGAAKTAEPTFIAGLRSAGARRVLAVSVPHDTPGIDAILSDGANAVEILDDALDVLAIDHVDHTESSGTKNS